MTGRRIVVTGSGSGIGAALAEALVARGDTVWGLDRSAKAPAGVEPILCDLADPDAVSAAAAALAAAAGNRLDGLANIAGVPGTAPAAAVLEVNVLGLRQLTEELLDALAPGAAIVHLASLAGYRSAVPDDEVGALLTADRTALLAWADQHGIEGPEAYQLSKKLVHRYSRSLAARLLDREIRSVSVSPGPVHTPILDDFRATMPGVDAATELVSRHGLATEVAAVVAFLLTPSASWVNGTDICVDGGLLAARAERG